MAFFICTDEGGEYSWHIPSAKPQIGLKMCDRDRGAFIRYLMADGDELEFIRARLENVPITKGGICVWRGILAAFVFDNL